MSATPLRSDVAAALTSGADIIDSIDVPILVVGGAVGANCAVSRFNSAAATLFSLTQADLGRRVGEIPMLANVKRLEELCGDAIAIGASAQCEVRDATNGSWFLVRIAPYMGVGREQQPCGAVLTLQNVTAFRASLEQAIYEREYTKAIVNTVIDPLVVLDDDCRVQAANQAFYATFQVSREQAQDVRLYEIGSQDWDIPRLQEFLKEPQARHESNSAEFEHELPGVGRRTVLLKARRLSQRGNVGKTILVSMQDITERKEREEARRRAEEELRDFVETAAIGMHWLGPDGKIVWANQTELDLLGYRREEYIGHTIAEFHANPRAADDLVMRLSRGESLREYPARLRCKNGSFRHVLITSSARFDGGKLIHTRCFTRDITEQVHAEERRLATERTLREKDSRFREMIDALPVPIYTTDAQGRLTHFNPASVEFSGRTPELGTDQWCVSWKLFWMDGRPMSHDECPMAVALREGRVLRNVEAIAERPDGTRITFVPYPTPLRDAKGRIVGGINMLLDITQRKQAEMVTASLAAIVESSDDAIIGKDLNSIITSWNKSAERLFGYTAEEAIGRSITMLIPGDGRQEESEIIARIVRGERVDHFETVRVRKDGRPIEISLTISPVKDSSGRIIGASKTARDITARKRAEEALRNHTARYETLLNQAPVGVYLVDGDFRIRLVNPVALPAFGNNPALIGRDFDEVIHTLWTKEYADEIVRTFRHTLETGEPYETPERAEYRIDRGLTEYYEWNINRISLPEGGYGVVCYFRDIAAQVKARSVIAESEERYRILAENLEVAVQARTQELEQRNADLQVQSERLRDVSMRLLQAQDDERRHIARNLHDSAGQVLAGLAMNLAGLERRAKEESPQLIGEIADSYALVQQLTREIRTTSYLLHPPLLDETGLVGALHWYIGGTKERSGLDIQLSIPEDFERLPAEIELVVFRLVQECLTNIHRHSGGKTAEVRLSREANVLCLEVRDDGKGIPPEKLSNIRQGLGGVGIGGMRERVRHFDGQLDIESNGSGTVISARFPLTQKSTSAKESV